jgi:N-acetylmuramic acid 6-phosphate etherase
MDGEPIETERANPLTRDLDLMPLPVLLEALVRENSRALEAVLAARESLAVAVEHIAERIEAGGRLHYAGAGTSGRLAVLDAAECPPTFGTPPDLVRAHIAGGAAALLRAVEGAEDDRIEGERRANETVEPGDVVVGISASGSAAFVLGFVEGARSRGALCIALANVAGSELAGACDLSIVLETGAEPLAGSTRLKAGTAQKIALSALSTAVMVNLGKVYDNLMVDVVANNQKLRRRALRLVETLVPTSEEHARALLDSAAGSVKVAVVMGRRAVDEKAARGLLAQVHGRLRAALALPSGG